jgi:hypothetical protein
LAFSADGSRLLAVSGNNEFSVWDVAEGAKLCSVVASAQKESVERLVFGGRLALSRDLSLAAQAIRGGPSRLGSGFGQGTLDSSGR